jgi:hypothetical protein
MGQGACCRGVVGDPFVSEKKNDSGKNWQVKVRDKRGNFLDMTRGD